MKVIVAGSRDISNFDVVEAAIAHSGFAITELVSGAASGVDKLGERWAEENHVPVKRFPAFWKTHGSKAGPMRNSQMAGYADALVAIWDGESKGTKCMIQIARTCNLLVYVERV